MSSDSPPHFSWGKSNELLLPTGLQLCAYTGGAQQQASKPAQAVRMAPSCDNFSLVYFRVTIDQ